MLGERLAADDARVVDEDVDLLERLDDLCDDLRGLLLALREVCLDADGLAAELLDGGDCLVHRDYVDDRDVRARFREPYRVRLADSAARARYDCDLAVELELIEYHVCIPFLRWFCVSIS